MKNKWVGFVLAVSVIFAVFITGCKGESTSENTVRVVIYDRGTDGGRISVTDNKWTQWIQEKVKEDLGLDIVFFPVSRWDEGAVQVTLLAAGNPPDLMMTYGKDNVIQMGENGGLFDMAPYVDTYLADVKAFLGSDEAMPGRELILRNQNMQTGQLFSIQQKRSSTAMNNVFMRKDWLDALGLPVPTTPEEFFNTLVAFRDRNPGSVDGVTPFIMHRGLAKTIQEAFIDPNLSNEEFWLNIIGERNLLVPGYKEGIRFLNRMYNAGLIDHDFPLYSDNDVTKRIIASGRVGAFESNWDYIFTIPEVQDGLRAIVPNAEWVALESFPHKLSNDITGLYVFIPKAAKNTEGAMRYLNWLAKFENYNFLQIGNEGINHELVDGLPRIKAPAGDGWFQNSYLNLDYTPLQNGMFLGSQEENIKAIALSYPFPSEMILQAYNAAMYNARPVPVVPTSKPLVAAGPLLATLNQQIDELLVQATVASPENFDKIWDTGVASILDSGARTIIEERKTNAILP